METGVTERRGRGRPRKSVVNGTVPIRTRVLLPGYCYREGPGSYGPSFVDQSLVEKGTVSPVSLDSMTGVFRRQTRVSRECPSSPTQSVSWSEGGIRGTPSGPESLTSFVGRGVDPRGTKKRKE